MFRLGHRRCAGLVVAALLADGGTRFAVATPRLSTIAVFPVENLSGGDAPLEPVRQALIARLTAGGVRVLDDAALEGFIARHRVRYAAGIDAETAAVLRQETNVEAALFASVELATEAAPPKFALTARLVSVAATPVLLWAGDAGTAGDDAPGVLELGIVNDWATLQSRALNKIADSLLAYMTAGTVQTHLKAASKFRPRTVYRGLSLDKGRQYSVGVLPFVNYSDRRNAGEIVALLFMRHLSACPQFRVVERGVVRRELLDARIIMNAGISISDAETVAALVDADYVLGGRVLRYDDYQGPSGRAKVEFSAVLIDRKTRKVVWSSDSYNDGAEGTGLFERGTTRTAHAMATQMVRITTAMIAGRD